MHMFYILTLQLHRSWWPARKIVEDALEKRFEVHPSGQVLEFTRGGVPWKEHLLQLEIDQGTRLSCIE